MSVNTVHDTELARLRALEAIATELRAIRQLIESVTTVVEPERKKTHEDIPPARTEETME